MARTLQNPSWYRVANLRPRLRSYAQLHRQRFRGEVWYILQDHQSGRFHRLSPAAHLVVCLMDGRRTVHEIWQQVGTRLGEDQPTQTEVIGLLTQLHGADLLMGEVLPHMDELAHRSQKQAERAMLMKLRNPLSLKVPLLDPDRFLDLTLPLVRPLFTRLGFLAWAALVVAGIVLATMHWGALTGDLLDRLLSAQNLILIILIYPVVKAIHELGHAYAAKVWGGEVHELGVMLLVFVPMPYVDASSSAAFREKWRRIIVGGAGIMVEAALAALAMIVWTLVEPGAVRAVAFNVMLICGVSTVAFNGNPLLRFDGYYVLADLLEMPNLGSRANRYVFYLVQRYIFRIPDLTSPATARGEPLWFVAYAVSAFFYRLLVMLGVALMVGTKFFFLGIALAAWGLINGLVMPLVTGLRYLAFSPQLQGRRGRALTFTAAVVGIILAALLVVPVPYATVAQGVVWLPERAVVRARTGGDVRAITANAGESVREGTPLFQLDDPELSAEAEVLEKQAEALQLRLDAVRTVDLVQANILQEQVRQIRGELEVNRQRNEERTVTASHDGRFLVPEASDLPGRYVRQGDMLGYVVGADDPVVRTVVPQADVDLVRRRTGAVLVRFADNIDHPVPASLSREVPAAQEDLPSPALSTMGGGEIAVDASKPDAPRALESLFQFELQVPGLSATERIGGRVYVRFDHGWEPIGFRMVRALRQLFLREFNV
ncbi:peptidase M50 [Aquabacter sp. CN5-332]|uniref:peptidase M50 n=1 Tax=Aquabacter sp. CN5-332 TaxID=3156608 RepID=UPI0032B39443